MERAKDRAGAVDVTADLKLLVIGIESCAATTSDGSYSGCFVQEAMARHEPSVGALAVVDAAPDPGAYQVAGTPANDGYLVQGAVDPLEGDTTWFAEIHRGDGSIFKYCGPSAATVSTSEPGSPTSTCPNGTWG